MERILEPSDFSADILALLNGLRPRDDNTNIYTPLHVVNQMLDILPKEIWKSKEIKFLDPVCKSGVFLREIAKRLICEQIKSDGKKLKGKDRLPYIQHVLKNQIFGISLSEEAGKVSRRTVYASQRADSKLSLGEGLFANIEGNIRYAPCGGEGEKASYPFLEKSIREIFGEEMKFDVIIGNPPYQMNVGIQQKSHAIPIFQNFIERAKQLNSRFVEMIIPSRWFSGGRGLDEFRDEMLKDRRICILHDFLDGSECFSDVEIKGGVCYFLWDRNYNGKCFIYTHSGKEIEKSYRYLSEDMQDIFIRYPQGVSIVQKVLNFNETSFATIVSPQTPFGLYSSFNSWQSSKTTSSIKLYANKKTGFIDNASIQKNRQWIDQWKLYVPKAIGSGNMQTDIIKPIIGEKMSACTQTYIMYGPFKTKTECENVISYVSTKFFHFLVGLRKNTQDAMSKVYRFVPLQDFSKPWTDAELYRKYRLTEKEIAFIEKMIRPMEP